jgi:hypothetical protein
MHFREEIKRRYPKTVARAQSGSRAAAMKLQCVECMGGDLGEVYACTDKGCWLFPFRPEKRSTVAKIATKQPENDGPAGSIKAVSP